MRRRRSFRTISSHTLVPGLLAPRAVVVDAGANVGEFSVAMAKEYQCQCVAIEPSPSVFDLIPEGSSLRRFHFALAAVPGELDLHVGVNSVSTSLHRSEGTAYAGLVSTPARTLDEFRGSLGLEWIDVLKMDIEGEELAVLESASGETLGNIGQITVEFHEWIGLGSKADVKRVMRRLKDLGFHAVNMSRTNYSDVLFVNGRLMSRAEFTLQVICHWAPRFFNGLLRRLGLGRKSRSSQAPSHGVT